MSKKILVTGSSGYVANYIMLTMAKKYPQATVIGMSRTGKPRNQSNLDIKNIEYTPGNCLEPETYKDVLQDVDACVHTIGVLVENKKNPQLTYQAMNADTVINMAKGLNETASEENKKNFVMISSAKAPPFLPEYLTTKQQGEQYLFDHCPNLAPYILRPGFIYNKDHRGWSIPLMYGVDLAWWMNENVGKKLPIHSTIDFLFPAKSTKLESVGHFAIEGVMGNLDPVEHKIINDVDFIDFEK